MQAKKITSIEYALAAVFILIGVISRVLPHPWNFAPISAIAMFGGVYLSRKSALILPLVAMFISDLFIGFYELPVMASVYLSFLLTVFIGFLVKKRKSWQTIIAGSVCGSVLFFLVTNFAVWAFSAWYPHNLTGLIANYILALPFFKNTLLGDLFYVSVFFGAYEAISVLVKRKLFATEEIKF